MSIPRVLHRVWLDEPVPERFDAYWRRFAELHPDWTLRTWGSLDEVAEFAYNADVLRSFPDGVKASYAFRSDIARYEILRAFGGVYVDTDVEALRAFDALLDDPRPFVAWCSTKELDPAVIASPAGHPAIAALVDAVPDLDAWQARWSPPGVTGPRLVTRVWRARPDVRRLPAVAFFPYHWSDRNGPPREYPSRTYAVHHWSAGWKA